jgi:hypothetical protein
MTKKARKRAEPRNIPGLSGERVGAPRAGRTIPAEMQTMASEPMQGVDQARVAADTVRDFAAPAVPGKQLGWQQFSSGAPSIEPMPFGRGAKIDGQLFETDELVKDPELLRLAAAADDPPDERGAIGRKNMQMCALQAIARAISDRLPLVSPTRKPRIDK